MAAPTQQEIKLVNLAIAAARDGFAAFADIQAFLTSVQFSPNSAGIATADWSDPTTPGPLRGFNPADFAAFVTSCQAIIGTVTANTNAVGTAFAALSDRIAST
jgi:hypothetical protein